ncbi:MAG: serine/threonine protein phosphatase [Dehalobacter sp. 4CP]|uniref:metallophosphoesterase family protein n=1 Tax=Dehalobacter sp. CP TaxID=2594474 RepID=UPI0013CA3CDB|nr:metallophosphoesterase family protein [Dehalobacter sp.]NBJ16886.1 serine/threonine protein phosphatase [Dehalobacter sp. 4CP]
MNAVDRISKAFQSAEEIPIDDSSKMILMSDVHRGDGSWADDFSGNENLYFAALTHYYKEQYTYIELGDGDELWKYKNMSDIVPVHKDTLSLLQKFYNEGRVYFIYGNHDMVKNNDHFVRKCFNRYYDAEEKRHVPLFENVKFREGLVLRYKDSERKILLIHGHQGSMLDYTFWGLRRFLVRYVWKKLELFGFKDPTSTAKNYHKKDSIEQNLTEWVNQEKHMLIAGHTHRPMFPDAGKPLYFNDGSCVHPRSITGIEIAEGNITLVKWHVKTKDDGTLYIGREVLAGPRGLKEYL